MFTPPPARAFTRAPIPEALASLLTLTFLAVLIRTAWLSDDALITLRTVLNITHGFGPRFNIDERVQTYTHPLWLGVLTAAYYVTSNVYFAAFVSSVLLSVLAFWTAITRAGTVWQSAAVVVLLFSSRAFVDFSTSGLENPLSYVLLAWVVYTFARMEPPEVAPEAARRLLARLWLGASLLYLTRPDNVVLITPLLAIATWRMRRQRPVLSIVIGLVPAILWTAFATVYYGFPFPNTAYAKLSMGIDPADLHLQGMLYLVDSMDRDPLTLTAIAFAVLLAIKQRHVASIGLGAGLLLYLVYIVSIGGDFMAGRFLAVPLFGAALIVGTLTEGRSFWITLAILFGALGSAASHAPFWSNSAFGDSAIKASGIIDERGVYFHDKSLVLARRSTFREPEWPKAAAERPPMQVIPTCGLMGTAGLDFGPYTHLLDECALADPLLAHLPAIYSPEWRTGHYRRLIPAGYADTLRHGEDTIVDRGVHDYYDHLRVLTRSDHLWSWARLKEIVAVDTGRYDHLIDRTLFRYGDGTIVTPNELANRCPDGTPDNDPLVHVIATRLAVVFPRVTTGRQIDVSLDSDDRYLLSFFRDGRLQSTLELGPIPEYRRTRGLMRYPIDIPPRAATGGFDVVLVTPSGGDGRYAIGHLLIQ